MCGVGRPAHNLTLARFRPIVFWLTVTVLGCGPSGPETAEVTGLVTFNGQPLPDAAVVFTPDNGRLASGVTDSEGRFELSTFGENDGALIGKHIVTITANASYIPTMWPDPPAPPPKGPKIPARYGSPGQSGLEADVKSGGPNELTFELTD
jgi:hypothetical protein